MKVGDLVKFNFPTLLGMIPIRALIVKIDSSDNMHLMIEEGYIIYIPTQDADSYCVEVISGNE